MDCSGRFVIQLGKLKSAPDDLDVIALPFTDCPSGMIVRGTIIYVPIQSALGTFELELVVDGPPMFKGGWDIPCSLNEIDTLLRLLEHLSTEARGHKIGRRLYRMANFSMKPLSVYS